MGESEGFLSRKSQMWGKLGKCWFTFFLTHMRFEARMHFRTDIFSSLFNIRGLRVDRASCSSTTSSQCTPYFARSHYLHACAYKTCSRNILVMSSPSPLLSVRLLKLTRRSVMVCPQMSRACSTTVLSPISPSTLA